MNVAIFGATGTTGGLLTERCLAAGHTVTALVRTPAKFRYAAQVNVVEGSVFDPEAVRQTLAGAEVVLSALGARSWRKEDVLERAIPVIVDEMRRAGVRRIIALGSAGALADSLKKQPAWRRWFVGNVVYRTALKWPVESQRTQWKLLSSSGLDFTMVMPPMLTNGQPRGRIRVDGEALPRGASRITRADVADFMIQQLASNDWLGRGVYIAW